MTRATSPWHSEHLPTRRRPDRKHTHLLPFEPGVLKGNPTDGADEEDRIPDLRIANNI